MSDEKTRRFTLSYSERLHSQKDFKIVFNLGRRLVHPAIFVYTHERAAGPEFARIGISISKKVGIAVKRNRVKRLLREIFRLNKYSIKPRLDLVFVPKKEAAEFDFQQLEKIVLSMLKSASALISRGKDNEKNNS